MKVYCKNCRYFCIGTYREYCKSNPEEKDSPQRRYKIYANVQLKNAGNDCEEYEKKWWNRWGNKITALLLKL